MNARTPMPSRSKPVDAIEVLNAMDNEWESIRGIAQKIAVYPSKENLDSILAICRSEQQTRHQPGMLSVIEPDKTGGYPYFRLS